MVRSVPCLSHLVLPGTEWGEGWREGRETKLGGPSGASQALGNSWNPGTACPEESSVEPRKAEIPVWAIGWDSVCDSRATARETLVGQSPDRLSSLRTQPCPVVRAL